MEVDEVTITTTENIMIGNAQAAGCADWKKYLNSLMSRLEKDGYTIEEITTTKSTFQVKAFRQVEMKQ
jgi:hypothetical protein